MSVISAAAGLAVLMIALFAWLRADMGRMEGRLTARIEKGDADLAARIEGVETQLTARIEGVEAQLTARIEGVEAQLTGRIEGVETQLTGRIGGLEQGNIDLRERMARIEGMLDGLRDSIAAGIDATRHRIVGRPERGGRAVFAGERSSDPNVGQCPSSSSPCGMATRAEFRRMGVARVIMSGRRDGRFRPPVRGAARRGAAIFSSPGERR